MGPQAILICLTFVLAAHTPALAPAQQPATPDSRKSVVQAELQQLVQRVQEGIDARSVAFARLVKKGPEAAVAAAEAVDSAKPKATARLLQLLEEMGPAATESVDVLHEKAETAEGEVRRLLYHTVVSIAPHMDPGVSSAQISGAQRALHAMMIAEEDEELRDAIAESWFRSVQYSVRLNGGVLTASTSVDDLSLALNKIKSYSFRHELAAVLLGYKSKEANTAIDALLAKMRKRAHRPSVTTSTGGMRIKYPCGPRNNRRIAAALLRLQPKPEIALEAHAYLLQKGLVYEQWQAIHTIRRMHRARRIPAVEKALVDLSSDPKAEQQLRHEALTTIGMLGAVEEPALEMLRKLASSTSKGLAVRAEAALRQLERRK